MSDSRTQSDGSPIPVRTAAFAAALGAWILWSGVVLTGAGSIVVNNFLSGAAIAAFASYTAGWPDGGPLPSVAAPLLVALFGLWVAVSPFVLGMSADRLLWSNVVAGALVALLAVGSVYGSWQLTQSRASRA